MREVFLKFVPLSMKHPSRWEVAFTRLWTEGAEKKDCFLFPLFISLVITTTLVRLISALIIPLSGDEAYYYQWSLYPSFGYYDHPPMVSWLTTFFSHLAGTSPVALRSGSILAALLSSLLIFALARNLGAGMKASFLAGSLLLLIPYLAIDSLMITPNASLILFWSLYLFLVQKALWHRSRLFWCLSGLALGLALLSKLMALFLVGSIILFILASPRFRSELLKPDFYLSLFIALIVFSPFLVWNYFHHWENFHFQLVERHRFPPILHPALIKDFLLLQALALSPFFFLLSLVALGHSTVQGLFRKDEKHLFCMAASLPILLFFIWVSMCERVEMYWPIAGYLTGTISTAFLIERLSTLEKGVPKFLWQAFLILTFTGLFLFTGSLYVCALDPPLVIKTVALLSDRGGGTYRGNGLIEMYAYKELAATINAKQENLGGQQKVFVMSDNYGLSSALSYYTGQHVHIYPPINLQGREYQRWEKYSTLTGMDALYVDRFPTAERNDIKEIFEKNFQESGSQEIIAVKERGIIIKTFYITHCKGFKGTWQE
jgi:hypothetical protein